MPAKVVAFVRRRRPPGEPKVATPSLRDLRTACRTYRQALFGQGGAAIDTLDTALGGPFLFARTLVQPDGDVVCMVNERYLEDEDLRLEHRESTARWLGDFRATVDGVVAMARTLTRLVSGLVVAVLTVTVAVRSILLGLLTGVVTAVVVPVLVRQGLRLAMARVLR